MPRVHWISKCRKSPGACGKCGKKIQRGEPYKWWKFRYAGKRVYCRACKPRPSDLTANDKLSRIYAAGESVEDALTEFGKDYDLESLRAALEEAAGEVRQVGEEYQESAENVGEYFPDSDQVSELEERAENLESRADDLESATSDLEEFEKPKEEDQVEQAKTDWAAEIVSTVEEYADMSEF